MVNENFKIGDEVQLKTGGPSMTVEAELESGKLVCVWFEKNTPKKDVFVKETLKKYTGGLSFIAI
jgi:uncharacterized protein YodC (DUF2158 family)